MKKKEKENKENKNGPTEKQLQNIEKIKQLTGTRAFVVFGISDEDNFVEIYHGNSVLLLGISMFFHDKIKEKAMTDITNFK